MTPPPDTHLPTLHARFGANLLRDLRSLPDVDLVGQLWANRHGRHPQRRRATLPIERGTEGSSALNTTWVALLNHDLGALSKKGRTDNLGDYRELASSDRLLIRRFHRYHEMILRFTKDPLVPWMNNQAERGPRAVQKLCNGPRKGDWRMLAGLTEFATVHFYLSAACR